MRNNLHNKELCKSYLYFKYNKKKLLELYKVEKLEAYVEAVHDFGAHISDISP